MERYALFCCLTYYPSGGWKDHEGNFPTIELASEAADKWESAYFNWEHVPWESAHYHVVDLQTGLIVKDPSMDS